jgi:catechol 2,3-dioxygenase-like lactoylglutathione lyase family enzyme
MSVVLDCPDPAALVEFWSVALGYRHATSVTGFEVLVPQEGEPPGPVLILQRVAEPKATKNRMHLDVHPPLDRGVPAHVAELEERGGRRVGGPVTGLLDDIGVWWQVMRDPAGNELCVVADPGHPAPDLGG